LDRLKEATPKTPEGRPKHHLHRRLSDDLGHPKLREHLSAVLAVMKLSTDYDDFIEKLYRVKPPFDELPLTFSGDAPSRGL
jgi:hypothetical protein